MSRASAARPQLKPFTAEHFAEYAGRLVFDDGENHPLEEWQLAIAEDVFAGYTEIWEVTPEANSKSTFLAQLRPLRRRLFLRAVDSGGSGGGAAGEDHLHAGEGIR